MAYKHERVWKVTLYMTESQWEELSKWSAPIAERETAPWLFLTHELSPEGEYEKKIQDDNMSIPEKIIYTVRSNTRD